MARKQKTRLERAAVGQYETFRMIGELMEKHIAATCKFSHTREEFLRSYIDAEAYDTLKAAVKFASVDHSREIKFRFEMNDGLSIEARIEDAGILTPATEKIRLTQTQNAILAPLRDAIAIAQRYREVGDVALAFYDQNVTPSAVQYHWPAGAELILRDTPEPRWAPFDYDLGKLRATVTLLATARLVEGMTAPRRDGLYARFAIGSYSYSGFTIPFADSEEDAK